MPEPHAMQEVLEPTWPQHLVEGCLDPLGDGVEHGGILQRVQQSRHAPRVPTTPPLTHRARKKSRLRVARPGRGKLARSPSTPLPPGGTDMTQQPTLQDPTTLYGRPPFDTQQQPGPGLAARMHPRPDHGEDSYSGTGRLEGRRALITGADS